MNEQLEQIKNLILGSSLNDLNYIFEGSYENKITPIQGYSFNCYLTSKLKLTIDFEYLAGGLVKTSFNITTNYGLIEDLSNNFSEKYQTFRCVYTIDKDFFNNLYWRALLDQMLEDFNKQYSQWMIKSFIGMINTPIGNKYESYVYKINLPKDENLL